MALHEHYNTAKKVVPYYLSHSAGSISLENAWCEIAEQEVRSESVRYKNCPIDAFLALCDAGLVSGISGFQTATPKKITLVKNIVAFVKANNNYQNMSYAEIWRKATGANKPSHQGEIAVVLGLYEAGHII